MKRYGMIHLMAALAAVLLFSATAFAQSPFGGGGGKGRGMHHRMGKGPGTGGEFGFLRHLNLTEAQEQLAQEIFAKYGDDMNEQREKLGAARKNLTETIHADKFSEVSVRQAFEKVSAAREELVVLRAKTLNELKGMLTAEQIEQWKTQREQMKQRMKSRMPFGPMENDEGDDDAG